MRSLFRERRPGAHSDAHVELLRTFADQAVIAIENARLFNETKEALDQLKASAEVLQVISSSVADTKPVFDKILESCGRLFDGRSVGISLVGEDGAVHLAAYQGPNQEALERHYPVPLSEESGAGAAILHRRVIHYPDVQGGAAVPDYVRRGATIAGLRSVMLAPMLREGRGIGAIRVGRATVGEFSEKEIALLKTFADQAVIAIENVRLFKELQARNRDLTEALEQQTATAEILRVISSSPTDVTPVFEEILRAAVHLCGAAIAAAFRFDGELLHLAATHNWPPEALAQIASKFPMPPDPRLTSGQAVLSGKVVRQDDTRADPNYDQAQCRVGRLATDARRADAS